MNSTLLFVFCEQKDLAQMPFTLRCAQCMGDKRFMRTAIHVWCKKFAAGQKFASDTEVQSTVHEWLIQQPASCLHQAFRNLLTDGINI